jgi:aspartyl-tRNA(Asn)/glutamyl-tRNA(Gln) amidotransferase subunit A
MTLFNGLSTGHCGVRLWCKYGSFDMSDKWLTQSASDLGRGIASGKINPVALTEVYLDAAGNHPFNQRIYARLTRDRAMAEAEAATKRAKDGVRASLLDGVPVSWKDLFDTAGTITEAGSALLKGRVPDQDAEVLQAATNAGLVCLGKTHMSELAFSGLGLNPVTQTSPCVNDHDAVAGGSSSGAATSVAFNIAAAGIGSDTGGSVRIPSAWNDLVGLKTTHGVLSLKGVVPLCAGFDTVGPLCRTVEDAAQLFAIMKGDKPVDLAGANLSGCRFGVLKTLALDDLVEAQAGAFDASLKKIKAAGAEIVEFEAPCVSEMLDLAGCLFTSEAYAEWHRVIEANPSLMFDEILARFRTGKNFSAVEFIESHKRMMQIRTEYAALTRGFDGVLIPTSPLLPPKLKRLQEDGDYFIRSNLLALRNTRIGNMMGSSVLTLPTGVPSCGLSVMGQPYEDRKMLRLGAAIEPIL